VAVCRFPTAALLLLLASPASAFDFDGARRKMKVFEKAYSGESCQYYGRKWATLYAKRTPARKDKRQTVWQQWVRQLRKKRLRPRRVDCTLYAQAVLEAGMDADDYARLRKEHNRLWRARGFAGWSVAHILTTKHGWKAYAVIGPDAPTYHYYMYHFRKRGRYPIWKQPDIKIEAYFRLDDKRDRKRIEKLLRRREFGWGFSEGGIHTWITSGVKLKECHYDKGPSPKYDIPESDGLFQANDLRANPLFKTTRFVKFTDYGVHLIVFPPDSGSS
jgi:hypothetical protein